MRILILGHHGRLGHVGVRYLKEMGHEVFTIDKRYDPSFPDSFFDNILHIKPDVIINCINFGPRRFLTRHLSRYSIKNDVSVCLIINALLPLQLSMRFPNTIIIHSSTDGIFSGKKITGKYNIDDLPNSNDIYGTSKYLGETSYKYPLTWVIRCSIIGPESYDIGMEEKMMNEPYIDHDNKGLLGWFLSHKKGETVYGYNNHTWNGVTTLEWMKCVCELLELIMQKKNSCIKIIQPGTKEIYSKADMLHMFSDIWGHNDIKIVDIESKTPVNRFLEPTWIRKPLFEQLVELYHWYYRNEYM